MDDQTTLIVCRITFNPFLGSEPELRLVEKGYAASRPRNGRAAYQNV
jgi:hypothetical protein